MRKALYVCLVFFCVNANAQPSDYDATITKIKSLIREHYVVTEKIKILLDSLGKGNFKGMKSQEFVDNINRQLQRYSGDKHLRLEYNPEYSRKVNGGGDVIHDQRENERRSNFGFNKVEILEGNTGLLRVTYFADPKGLEDLIRSAFNIVSNTDQLIIDLR